MKQDLPSYIANDAAPLFPDLSAMSDEEFSNYESPPERLAFYRLHTEEGLKAFLYDVYWIGYPGLFIAANHVWDLLIAPTRLSLHADGPDVGCRWCGQAGAREHAQTIHRRGPQNLRI